MRKSWEVCRGESNSGGTRDNVKDLDVCSINKKKILKGSKKDNDEMRSVISKNLFWIYCETRTKGKFERMEGVQLKKS